jgi:glycosyltransferase involved in cell wall biosynthesis
MIYINGRFLTQDLSGAQRFAYEILKGLVEHTDLEINILVPPSKIREAYDVEKFTLKIIGKRTNLLWEQIDLPLYLNKNGKVLLINLLNTAPFLYKNQVVSILDMTTFINPKWFNRSFSYYYKLIVPIIAKNSLKIITISECSKIDITKFINVPPEKIEILYCAVAEQFNENKNRTLQQTEILNKLNIQQQKFLLAVSSLDPRKNFIRLVRAYNEIKADIFPLVIVGSEGKVFANDELKEIITNSKNIILTGYLTDSELVALYQSANCFIYPSLYEGFGMPPLEAMACGCPTIVSNTSSLPESCGDASLFIDPNSTESIKNAIIELIGNSSLRLKLIEEGKKQVKKFSWEKSSKKLTEIIKDLI